MAKEISIKGVDRVVKNLSNISEKTFHNIVMAAEAVQAQVVNRARQLAPKVTHNLERSIQAGDVYVMDDNVTAVVMANAQYASYVEEGTAPHFPPLDPLRVWAGKVLGDESAAYPIARKIAERGVQARPFLLPALNQNMPTFRRAIMKAVKL